MSEQKLLRTLVDSALESRAATVLAERDMTVSEAIKRLLTHVANEKSLPIELLVPNAETLSALEDARTGKVARFNSVEALLDDLHADD